MTARNSTSTIGLTIGKALGNAAAYTVHGAVRVAEGTGRVGADIVAGASAQYSVKAEELATRREQMRAELKARAEQGLLDIAKVVAEPAAPVAAEPVRIKAPRRTAKA